MDTCSLVTGRKMPCCGTYLVSQNVQAGYPISRCCHIQNRNSCQYRYWTFGILVGIGMYLLIAHHTAIMGFLVAFVRRMLDVFNIIIICLLYIYIILCVCISVYD